MDIYLRDEEELIGSPNLRTFSTGVAAEPRDERIENASGRSGFSHGGIDSRPVVRGKFIFVGNKKLQIKGVTYGPFRPDEDGCEYGSPTVVSRDFELMVASGINVVRTYTIPPRWFLDEAGKLGLRVMVGLPWEQHVAFLDSRAMQRDIERRVRDYARSCAGHPALLCFTIGNEIPASIVRWYGRHRIERFLKRLYRIVKAEDSMALVTYVNFPTTEYLQLPFLDFYCFNVYLETPEKLNGYLARLQNLADDRPLVMAEIGLDSMRNGEDKQAAALDWQIRASFAAGCAGAFVFSWTDEWHRGGHDIDDWAFGLTTRDREPKLALDIVRDAFSETPFSPDAEWPQISVVVCTYNGGRTIRQTCEQLEHVQYPNFEVIIVVDGSTDDTMSIMSDFDFRVIDIPNGGLSAARNVGMRAATGEIVAYLDDDAYPDPHWLQYLAWTFMQTDHVGVGGPNIPPPGDGDVAECVAHSPGRPNHVLLSDQVAEHIPGCNMAFRKAALEAIGGFDERFTIAGDDVDICWRLQECGGTLGFSPGAMVWHHCRNSVSTYLRQQRNYGRAERMLEVKWPRKYNAMGHVRWAGRVYGSGITLPLFWKRFRIYHGVWGSGLFQSMYTRTSGLFRSLPLMPEWYAAIATLLILTLTGLMWQPLFLVAAPLLALVIGLPAAQAMVTAFAARIQPTHQRRWRQWRSRSLIAYLHFVQPLVRLHGRLCTKARALRQQHHHARSQSSRPFAGLPPIALPIQRSDTRWFEKWDSPENRLQQLEENFQIQNVRTQRGGDYDDWDLDIRVGTFAYARIRTAIEEHGGGKQLWRIRCTPKAVWPAMVLFFVFGGVAIAAGLASKSGVAITLGSLAVALIGRIAWGCARVMACYRQAIQPPVKVEQPEPMDTTTTSSLAANAHLK